MGEFNFCRQLEMYSNAILAFMVFQGLAFCYQVGTNRQFNQILKTERTLSLVLIAALVCVLAVSIFFNFKISATLQAKAGNEEKRLVRQIYLGKLLVLCLFGLLPIFVTWRYGLW